jgi:hypothetical protein
MDDSAAAFHAQLAALSGAPEFLSWQQDSPTFKPRLSGILATAQGTRHIPVLLDTSTTHCFIRARLAAALDLCPRAQRRLRGQPRAARWGSLRRCGSTWGWARRLASRCWCPRWTWTIEVVLHATPRMTATRRSPPSTRRWRHEGQLGTGPSGRTSPPLDGRFIDGVWRSSATGLRIASFSLARLTGGDDSAFKFQGASSGAEWSVVSASAVMVPGKGSESSSLLMRE